MIPDYKNNYKKFFRQYLFVAGAVFAFILIIDAFAWAGPHRNVNFNKSFTDTVPGKSDTVPLSRTRIKDTTRAGRDTTPRLTDSTATDTTVVDTLYMPKLSKDSLDAPVNY